MKGKMARYVIGVMACLCMFVLWPSQVQASAIPVSTWDELTFALHTAADEDMIVMAHDIIADGEADVDCALSDYPTPVRVLVGVTEVRTLDLGGHTLTMNPDGTEPGTNDMMLRQVLFTVGERNYFVSNNSSELITYEMDVAPYINPEANRTMLPVRYVADALGMVVDFDDATREVYLASEGMVVRLNLDSTLAYYNDHATTLESPPAVVAGRTMLPIGEIADLIGLSRDNPEHPEGYLQWIPEDRSVLVQRYVEAGLYVS